MENDAYMTENKELCTSCGGKCCKSFAGTCSPVDFEEMSYKHLKTILDTGKYSIDWWEGKKSTLFIRPRHKNSPIVDPAWKGECNFLASTGCELPYEKRPTQCKELIPMVSDKECYGETSKKELIFRWKPYQQILRKLELEYI